jgi:hypothetical protein
MADKGYDHPPKAFIDANGDGREDLIVGLLAMFKHFIACVLRNVHKSRCLPFSESIFF